MTADIDELCINTIRTLAIDAIERAKSGHPGLPMGAAPMAYVLWQRHLRHSPENTLWPNRDRFVLSAGHGSMLLYSLLHLSGYDLSLDDLRQFRQWQSRTPGHPEWGLTPGVEATTGPLGQGTANAVGMAMAERALAHRFHRPGYEDIVDHYTYALVSDGDVMEGIAAEAASLAGHLRLGKLIYLYDANDVTLDGPADMSFSEDVCQRYASYGWHVGRVDDGDRDLAGLDAAIVAAKAETERPSLILVRTTIGYGSPKKAGSSASHGAPLGTDEVVATKQALGWDPAHEFHVPDQVRAQMDMRTGASAVRGRQAEAAWRARMDAYAKDHPALAQAFEASQAGTLPAGWDADMPSWEAGAMVATRDAGGKAEQAIAARVGSLIGGDADLGGSTKTVLPEGGRFDGQSGAGRNIHFGVREHAMGAIANGILYHGGLRPFVATFFVFSDYMRPAMRLAALNHQPAIYVFTHDSVGVGEDGPTHQPVEHLMALRAVPHLQVVRPADANETADAWRYAMARSDGPTALVFTRQKLPVLDRGPAPESAGERYGVNRVASGGYVIADMGGASPQGIIIATGSEVSLAVAAGEILAREGHAVRVVAMPCWEAFSAQSEAYREAVLPASVTARVSVEAGVTFGWERWIGSGGTAVGLDRFGASAPGPELMEHFGFTAEAVADKVRALLSR